MTVQEYNQILMKRVSELEQENRKLHETITYLTGKLLGSSSEKSSALQIEGQLSLLDETEELAEQESVEPVTREAEKPQKKKRSAEKCST